MAIRGEMIMKNARILLIVLLVFAAGFAGGVVATRAFVRHGISMMVNDPDHLRQIIARRMARQLKLDAEQRVKVDKILEDTQKDLRALREEFGPRFQVIMSNAQSEISYVLTPEQR